MPITFVNSADLLNNGGTSNTYTVAYTCAGGANRLIVLAIEGDNASGNVAVPVVTYGGVAMTLVIENPNTGGGTNLRANYLFYLLGASPAAGSHNFVIDFSPAANQLILPVCAEYNGVLALDATGTNTSLTSVSSLTTALTTIADNCWTVLMEQHSGSSSNSTAGAGLSYRANGVAFNQPYLFDSNGPVTPPQSYSMTVNLSVAQPTAHTVASFSPVSSAPAVGHSGGVLLGVVAGVVFGPIVGDAGVPKNTLILTDTNATNLLTDTAGANLLVAP